MSGNGADGQKHVLWHELAGVDGWSVRLKITMENLSDADIKLLRKELWSLWAQVGVEMVRRGYTTEE